MIRLQKRLCLTAVMRVLLFSFLARDRKDGRKEGAAQEEEDAAMTGF